MLVKVSGWGASSLRVGARDAQLENLSASVPKSLPKDVHRNLTAPLPRELMAEYSRQRVNIDTNPWHAYVFVYVRRALGAAMCDYVIYRSNSAIQ